LPTSSNSIWRETKLEPAYRKPFDLLAVTNKKAANLVAAESRENRACSTWLPDSNALRNISEAWLMDEVHLHAAYKQRQLRLVQDSPVRCEPSDPSKRRWRRNPIQVAMELKAEMERRPGLTQDGLAAERGVTRTRVCQYLNLLKLPGDIVEFMVDVKNEEVAGTVAESALRELLRIGEPAEMGRRFRELIVRQVAASVDSRQC